MQNRKKDFQLKYFYIYNYKQALFFIQNGLKVIDIDKGKENQIYHKFIRDDKSEQIFMNWKQIKYGDKAV